MLGLFMTSSKDWILDHTAVFRLLKVWTGREIFGFNESMVVCFHFFPKG